MIVNMEKLARLFPRPADKAKAAIWDGYMEALGSPECDALFRKYQITTVKRVAHVLATWAHETGGFTVMWESGAYSASRLLAIFGVGKHSAGVTASEAKRLAGNAYATFERVYGIGNPKKAKELGNTVAGDGFNFRGLGIQQLTGKADHFRYAEQVGCTPAQLCLPINAIHAALLEWTAKRCNPIADRDDVVAVRKKINGGTNGLDDVRGKLAAIKKILDDQIELRKPGVIAELGDRDDPDAEEKPIAGIQNMLNAIGYPVGAEEGAFGPLTENMVVAFQHARGLPVDGKVDKATLALLQATPAEPSLPGREHLTEQAAASKLGSTKVLGKIKAAGQAVYYGTGIGTVLSWLMGLDVIGPVISAAEHGKSLMDRTTALAGVTVPPWVVGVVITMSVGAVLMKWANSGVAANATDAKESSPGRPA